MRWFRVLKSREVRVALFYSDGDPGLSELAHYFGRGRDRFRDLPNVEVSLLSAADHALLEPEARSQFIEEVCRVVCELSPERSGSMTEALASGPNGRPSGERSATGRLRMKTMPFSRS